MSRRDEHGQFAREYSFFVTLLHWLSGIVGLVVLYVFGRFIAGNFAAFRSCDHNNSGLSIESCGKQGLNLGDLVLVVLFVVAAVATISLFNRAWRMSRRSK